MKVKEKKVYMVVLIALMMIQIVGGSVFAQTTAIVTTADKTIYTITRDQILKMYPEIQMQPTDVINYKNHGYGIALDGDGVPITKRADILGSNAAPTKAGTKLLGFFTMSDIHITDVQSPAQCLVMGITPEQGMSSAYSASIPYTTQVLDAAVRTANAYSSSNQANKFDFGLMLGDAINSAQKNELQMYLAVLKGGTVNPNSDPKNTYKTDFTQKFTAEGLKMPWYQVLGNHDHFWSGVLSSNEKLRKALTGDTLMKIGSKAGNKQLDLDEVYGGIIDPSQDYSQVKGAGIPNPDTPDIYKITPNPDRTFLTDRDFIANYPAGHGLKTNVSVDPLGCYAFVPKTDNNIPVKVIVLNDTSLQENKFMDGTNAAYTYLTEKNFKWLQTQLVAAQKADQLIIVAMHIPTGMRGLWSKSSPISEIDFINELHKYPNMLMLLAGHRHLNTIICYPYPDASGSEKMVPENGFWQVETASLRDYPQQFRAIKIELYADGIVGISVTDIDPIAEKDSMVEKARGYAMASSQIFPEPRGIVIPADTQPSRVENAILYKKLTPNMTKVLSRFFPKDKL